GCGGASRSLLEAKGRSSVFGRTIRVNQIQFANRRDSATRSAGSCCRRIPCQGRNYHHREDTMIERSYSQPLQDLPNPPRRGLKNGWYLIPSVFTAANSGMGFYAVMAALRGFQLVAGSDANLPQAAAYFDNAAIAIGWAVLFDMLDGRIARMTKTTTEIGIQLDSIADVVTFG